MIYAHTFIYFFVNIVILMYMFLFYASQYTTHAIIVTD